MLYRSACQVQFLKKWHHLSQRVFAYLGVDPEYTAALDRTLQSTAILNVRDTCDFCDAEILENEIDLRCSNGHYFGALIARYFTVLTKFRTMCLNRSCYSRSGNEQKMWSMRDKVSQRRCI